MQILRLTPKEIKDIKQTILKFDSKATIKIFGSRTNPKQKGGDIDILVISQNITPLNRRKIRTKLLLTLGERKIDLIVTKDPNKDIFTKIANRYGVAI